MRQTPFYDTLLDKIHSLGGYHNAHLHLDRAYTLPLDADDPRGALEQSYLSLSQKHGLIQAIHDSDFYSDQSLTDRLTRCIDVLVGCGTRRADTLVDTTDDGLGLRALEIAVALSDRHQDVIDLRAAVYSPLGFRDDEPQRWALMEEGAKIAQFIASLPEKDDRDLYPDHIGYDECCRRMIDLAKQSNTFLHVHTDQMNSPRDCGTERLLDVIDRDGSFVSETGEPMIWAVHMISPSTYDTGRWQELVARLRENHVGVICCPSGALGMRQLRHELTPTYNSIARVFDLLLHDVPVRLGSDNISDMLSPSSTLDLMDEIYLLSAAQRFYDIDILAKVACAQPLDDNDKDFLRAHLETA